MYADREGGATTVSIKDRLNLQNAGRRPQFSGKRKSQDDGKWEHDLYDGRVHGTDLRFKLQKKTIQKAKHSGKISILGGTKDLREKLSGTVCRKALEDALRKPKTITEARKPPAMKVSVVEAPVPETKKVASTISKKKAQEKVESVDSFLHFLGLEKYALTFQAEEVDMATLLHMNDEDLKALSIPMGPRKKILLALASCV